MNRPILIVLAGLFFVVVAVLLSLWTIRRDEQISISPSAATQEAPVSADQAASLSPEFDMVRVNAQGETMIAGHAAPRAEVVLRDGDNEFGRVIADNRGEWVFVPDHQTTGIRTLTLQAANPDGSATEATIPLVLIVCNADNDKPIALALTVKPDNSLEILHGPDAKNGIGTVLFGRVQNGQQMSLSLSGKDAPKSRLQIYVDNQPFGHGAANDEGVWRIDGPSPKDGNHVIRLEAVLPGNKQPTRAEVAQAFAAFPAMTVGPAVTVSGGPYAWRLTRHNAGGAFDYQVICALSPDHLPPDDKISSGQSAPSARP